ncbi:hypothetical protein QEN19_000485 [Hanseniaspora menglaensis]
MSEEDFHKTKFSQREIGSNHSIISNTSTATTLNKNTIWKYYKLYEDTENKKTNLSFSYESNSNIVKVIQSRNTVLFTTTASNKDVNIFDSKKNELLVSNLNINDTDIDLHHLVDVTVVESSADDIIFIVAVFEVTNNENSVNSPYIIKIFNYEDIISSFTTKKILKYHTMITINDNLGKNKYPITSFIINNELDIALMSLGNGNVYLVRGDLKRDRGYKQRLIFKTSDQQPITNLKFINNSTQVILSTVDKILILNTDGKIMNKQHLEENFFKIVNDREGCSLKLLDSYNDEKLICLNDNFINVYNFKSGYTKTESVLFNTGYKTLEPIELKCLNDSEILVISRIISSSNETNETFKLSVLNLKHHITTLNYIFNNPIKEITLVTNSKKIELILQTGRKYSYEQKTIDQIINIFLEQPALTDFEFQLAISFLKQRNISSDAILKKYGDFLYAENRSSEAMQQYISCIDYFLKETDIENNISLEKNSDFLPSITDIVIKFAVEKKETLLNDNETLNNLVLFLQKLLQKEFDAKQDYTTLLMILLIKLNLWEEFDNLVDMIDRNGNYSIGCGSSKEDYYNFTLEEDELYWFSDIIIFDVNLITQLLIETNKNSSNEYGGEIQNLLFKILVKFSRNQEQIVSILINELEDVTFALAWIQRLDPASLMNLIFGPAAVGKLLIDINYKDSDGADSIINLYTELFTGKYKQSLNKKQTIQTYQPPKPSIIFNFFLENSARFALFLEQILESATIENKFEHNHCINALYATYLKLNLVDKAENFYQQNKDSISELILHDYKPNINDLNSILNLAISTDNVEKVIEIEKNSDYHNKEILIKILRFIIKKQSILTKFTEKKLENLIQSLLEKKYLSMIELIAILSESNVASFGAIKYLLIDWIKKQEENIEQQKIEIEHFENQKATNKVIENNQANNNICFTCELPVRSQYYKFNCGHLVHKTCIAEKKDILCPYCGHNLENIEQSMTTINNYAKNNDREISDSLNINSDVDSSTCASILIDLISKGALEI